MARYAYISVSEDKLPADLRWDTPRQNQGQIFEVSYADWPTCADEACNGSKYRRDHDRSDNTTTYYERV